MTKEAKEYLESKGIDITEIIESQTYKGATYDLCYLLDEYKDNQVENLNLFVVSKTVCPNCYDNKVIEHKESDKSTCVDCGFQWQTGC